MTRLPPRTRRVSALLAATAALLATAAPAPAAGIRTGDIVSAARQELSLGVRELPAGSNRAPSILRYESATTGAHYGAPWCAYFVSYLARAAGVPIGDGGRGIGSTDAIRAWAVRTGRWSHTPRPGRLIVFPQHAGVVERARGGGVTIIEGNWSDRVGRRSLSARAALGYVAVDTAASFGARRLPARGAVVLPAAG